MSRQWVALLVVLAALWLSAVDVYGQPQSDTCGPYGSPVPCGPPANNALPPSSSTARSKLSKYTNFIILYFTANGFDFLFSAYPNANNIQRALQNGLYNPQITETGYLGGSNQTYTCLPPDSESPPYVTNTSRPFNTSSCIPNAPFEISQLIPLNATWSGDPKHTWFATQYNINGGLMNGYVWASGKIGGLSMGYYNLTGSYLYQLAANYTLFDQFFMSTFGGIMVNHQYMIAAHIPTWNNTFPGDPNCPQYIYQCYGGKCTNTTGLYPSSYVDADGNYLPINDNSLFLPDCHVVENVDPFTLGKSPNLPALTNTNIGDLLDTVGATWTYYYQSWNITKAVPVGAKTSAPISLHENPFTFFYKFADVNSSYTSQHIKDDDQFYSDLANGYLSNVTWVKPDQSDGMGLTDNNPYLGQLKLQSYMNAIFASSYWKSNTTMVIFTVSDTDGVYDHVPPYVGDWSGPGTRVPTIIISPDHAGGKINSQPYETGSILKLIETRFGITDTMFAPARWNSTADLTKSLGDDAVTYTASQLDVGATVTFIQAPVTALIDQSYTGCPIDVHSMAKVPLMMTLGGEKLQSAPLLTNDVWLSLDGWATAQPKGQSIMADGTGPVVPRRASAGVYLSNGNVVWLGGKNGTAPIYTNLVTYSTDLGTTWYTATAAAAFQPRSDIAACVLPKTNTIVVAGGNGVVNGGTQGTQVFFSDVWVSSDGKGAQWTRVANNFDVPFHGGSCVGLYDSSLISPSSTQAVSTIFIVSSYATSNYRSIDGGYTWEILPVPWAFPSTGNGGGETNERIFMSLAVDYDNVLYVLGGAFLEFTNDVWASSSKGSTWTKLTTGNAPNDPFLPFYLQQACLAMTYVPSSKGALVKQLTLFSGTYGMGLPNFSIPIVTPDDIYNKRGTVNNPININTTLYAQVTYNPANTLSASVATITFTPTQQFTNNVVTTPAPTLLPAGGSTSSASVAASSLAFGSLPNNAAPACAIDVNSRATYPTLVYAGGASSANGAPSNQFYTSKTGFGSAQSVTATTPSSAVTAVSGAGMVIIAANSAILFMGGATATGFSNQVVASTDAQTWTAVAANGGTQWSARAGFSTCSAPGTNVVFVIGGQNSATNLSETWTTTATTYASGLTWTQQTSTGLPAFSYSAPCVATSSSSVIVANQFGTIYRSVNGGSSYSFIASLPFAFQGPRASFQMQQDVNGYVWSTGGVSVADGTYTQGEVFVSRDGGVNWYVALPAAIASLTGGPRLSYTINSCLGFSYGSSAAFGASSVEQVVFYGGNISFSDGSVYSAMTSIPITGSWSFCGVLQGANYLTITSALLTTNTTYPLKYSSNPSSFFAVAGPTTSGTRTFYNLTQGPIPVAQQVDPITALANTGSTGGNTNFFYPTSTPELDGDGLTFNFSTIPLIDGQGETFALGASVSMNFWFTDGEYYEETKGGTHQNPAFSSSLAIVPVPVGSTTYPTCSAASTTQWLFCAFMVSSTYAVTFSGTFTAVGVATPYAPTTVNQLSQTEQGLRVLNATGTRTFTNILTNASTTTTVVSLAGLNSFGANTNLIYPNGPLVTDAVGIAFTMSGASQVAGQTSTSTSLLLFYQPTSSQYTEAVGAVGAVETTPLDSYFAVQSYSPYSGGYQNCNFPTLGTTPLIYFTFCSQLAGGTFTSTMSGVLTVQDVPLQSSPGGPIYYLVVAATGSRTYTDFASGNVTVNRIISLAVPGQTGGNDNFLYVGSQPLLDGDGLTFVFDSPPPVAGQPQSFDPLNQMNWWFDGPTYLEETAGGTHENTPIYSFASIQQVSSASAAVPTCQVPVQTGYLCALFYSLPGNVDYPWSSATSVQFTYYPYSPFNSYSPVAAVAVITGTGTRTYTNRFAASFSTPLTVTPPGTQNADNLLLLNSSSPVDSNGLTLTLAQPVQLPGNGPNQPLTYLNIAQIAGIVQEGTSQRIDATGSAFLSDVPSFTNITIGAANINALAANYATCQAPISFTNGLRTPTQPTTFNGAVQFSYSYSISDGATYTISASLTITTTSAFANSKDQLGNPYQIITGITGTRNYTYLPTLQTIVSTVSGLSTTVSPYVSQRFYPYALLSSAPGVYTMNTAPFFDYDGIAFNLSPPTPWAGNAPAVGPQINATNLLFSATGATVVVLTELNVLTLPLVQNQVQNYVL